jgi:hypothetical protein
MKRIQEEDVTHVKGCLLGKTSTEYSGVDTTLTETVDTDTNYCACFFYGGQIKSHRFLFGLLYSEFAITYSLLSAVGELVVAFLNVSICTPMISCLSFTDETSVDTYHRNLPLIGFIVIYKFLLQNTISACNSLTSFAAC